MDIRNLLNEPENTAKPFQCYWADCKKAFLRQSDLSRHIRIHTGERPYLCKWPTCEKRFIQRSALKVHFRTHTGEKPHICEYELCGKSFSDFSSLVRHRRTHTGTRPYACQYINCGKSFTRKTALSKHIWCHDPSKKQYKPSHEHAAKAAVAMNVNIIDMKNYSIIKQHDDSEENVQQPPSSSSLNNVKVSHEPKQTTFISSNLENCVQPNKSISAHQNTTFTKKNGFIRYKALVFVN